MFKPGDLVETPGYKGSVIAVILDIIDRDYLIICHYEDTTTQSRYWIERDFVLVTSIFREVFSGN